MNVRFFLILMHFIHKKSAILNIMKSLFELIPDH